MSYQHRLASGESFPYGLGKIVCVGRNYADHARELGNAVPSEPILFIKPATAAVPMDGEFTIPKNLGSCHVETEMALLIGETLTNASPEQALAAIAGVGLAYDLTLRQLQDTLKDKSQPWEKAKSFDGACPLSDFIAPAQVADWADVDLRLTRNGQVQQQGNSGCMITSVVDLLVYSSRFFTLQPGDVVITGTPAGVGPLSVGDKLQAELVGLLKVESRVI